jgi:MurNAc alpha-1-phosphate uridylyltransferase
MTTPHTAQAPTGMKALIFAAGLGTRLKPFTDHHPKALAMVNGKPLLQRNIEYLAAFGIRDFIVNVHHFADQIISFLKENDNFGYRITVSHEVEQPLETGGGLKYASWFFESEEQPFLVMNADILTNLDLGRMLADHRVHKPLATLAITDREASRVFLFSREGTLCGWTNRNTGEERISRHGHGIMVPGAFTCVHLIEPEMLRIMPGEGKFSIIDTYLELAKTHVIRGYRHNGDIVLDVGRPSSIIEAERLFA